MYCYSCLWPAQLHEKHAFWDNLKSLNVSISLPWCILGDFNEMLHPSEKIGGTHLCGAKLQWLNDFLTHCKGHDANVQGWIFTWKKFLHGKLIYEKHDRAILREDCFHLFPNYLVTNSLAPIILMSILTLNLLILLERAQTSGISIHGPNIMIRIA